MTLSIKSAIFSIRKGKARSRKRKIRVTEKRSFDREGETHAHTSLSSPPSATHPTLQTGAGLAMATKRCVLYDEIGAKARGLLEKDFAEKTTIETTIHPCAELLCARAGGLALGVRGAVAFNRDGSTTVTLAPTAAARGAKLAVDVTNAKTKRVKAKLTHEGLLPGLRMGLDWALRDAAHVATAYRHARFSLQSDILAQTAPALGAAAAVQLPRGIALGATATYTLPPLTASTWLSGGKLSKAEGCVAYTAPRFELTAYTASLGRIAGFNAWGRVNPRTTAAVDVRFDTTKKVAEAGMPLVEAGVQYQIDATSSVKAKVNTDCVVGVSYIHQLSRYARAVFSGSANAANLSTTGNHTFGFSLVLSD